MSAVLTPLTTARRSSRVPSEATSEGKEPTLVKDRRPAICQGFHAATRSWNCIVKASASAGPNCVAKRVNVASLNGAVAVGDGRLAHFPDVGHFYCLSVDEFDFSVEGTMAFAIGVTTTQPAQFSGLQYAYHDKNAILFGYGSRSIFRNKWGESRWDSRQLRRGDKVSLLVTAEDIVVFVNGKQRSRMAHGAPIADEYLYPIVDIIGGAQQITMLPREQPHFGARNLRGRDPPPKKKTPATTTTA